MDAKLFKVVRDSAGFKPTGETIVVQAWSGNVKPFLARVFINGVYVARTGFCKTEARAVDAAKKIAQNFTHDGLEIIK